MFKTDLRSSNRLIAGGSAIGVSRNCGSRVDCSVVSGWHPSLTASTLCWGNSYKQNIAASRSDIRWRNRQATISHALARVSLIPPASIVEKCHFNVLPRLISDCEENRRCYRQQSIDYGWVSNT